MEDKQFKIGKATGPMARIVPQKDSDAILAVITRL